MTEPIFWVRTPRWRHKPYVKFFADSDRTTMGWGRVNPIATALVFAIVFWPVAILAAVAIANR